MSITRKEVRRIVDEMRENQDLEGAAIPYGSVTPTFINQRYFDTRTSKAYRATGLTTSSWVLDSPVQPIGAMKAILLGDSITSIMGNYSSGSYIWAETRWFNVMQWKLGYPFIFNQAADFTLDARIGHNAGVNGDTTTQMLARLETDVLAKNPDIVFILAGTNDLANSAITDTTVITNLQTMYEKILSTGAAVVAIPILPRNSSSDWPNANQRKRHLKVNAWIKQYCRNKKGMIYLDLASPITNTSGEMNTLYSNDGLHPNTLGGWVMGLAAYNQMQYALPKLFDNGLYNPTDDYDATYNQYGNLVNGDFSGTGGTKTGSQVSGTVPDSWILVQTGTPVSSVASSITTRSDGKPGAAVQLRYTTTGSLGSTAEEFAFRTASSSTGVVTGEYYQLEMDIELTQSTGGSTPLLGFSLQLVDVANSKYANMGSNPAANSYITDSNTGIMTVRTPPFKALTGASFAAYLYMKVNNQASSGTVDVKVSRAKLYRLPTAPDFN